MLLTVAVSNGTAQKPCSVEWDSILPELLLFLFYKLGVVIVIIRNLSGNGTRTFAQRIV